MTRTAKEVLAGVVFVALLGSASAETIRLEADPMEVARWNRFTENLYALHTRLVANHELRVTERVSGYHRWPDFFRELTYRDARNDRLLSIVQWEREHPDLLHTLEVNIYDDSGKVVRDYYTRFLPFGRNAPVQTLINFHAYNGKLHAFRQFDASDKLLYEDCRGEHEGQPVRFELDEDDLYLEGLKPDGVLTSAAYRECFKGLPQTAGVYLAPQ
jgi:hypothetical protein